MAIRERSLVAWLGAAIALAGCLPDELSVVGTPILGLPDGSAPVETRPLHIGRGVEFPRSYPVWLERDMHTWLFFNVRTRVASPTLGGTLDYYALDFDTGEKRLLVRDRSDVWDPALGEDGLLYVMRRERLVQVMGQPQRLATLSRVALDGRVVEDIPDVTGFSFASDGRMYYRRGNGTTTPALHLRSKDGRERVITDLTGGVVPFGNESYFLTLGPKQTLSRLLRIDAPVEPLRAGVSRTYFLSDRTVVMTVPDNGTAATVVFDVDSRTERKLPGKAVCCLLGMEGNEFVYAEGAGGGGPARLHHYDIGTSAHREVALPLGLADVSGILRQPNTKRALYLDSGGRAVLSDPDATPPLRLLPIKPYNASFTTDGKYLLFVELTALAPEPEGTLQAQETSFTAPPRLLTPVGATIQIGQYFTDRYGDPEQTLVVFWAHFGRSGSDLYFADPETGSSRVVARQIRDVSVTPRRVFGIIEATQQDLVGRLVSANIDTGEQLIIGRSVDSFAVNGQRVAFFVRNRVPSSQDGLYGVTLP